MLQRALGSWRFTVERTPLSSRDLAARYDRAAPDWDRHLGLLGVPRAYRRLLQGLLTDGPLRTLPNGAWVLDAGTGTGALSLALASAYDAVRPPEKPGDPLLFSAVDRAPAMLRQARAAFDAARLDVALRCGDLRRLPYEDATFDLVMAGHVLEHLPDPRTAVHELVRVLRPGAPLLVLATRRSLLGTLVHLRWRTHQVREDDVRRWFADSGVSALDIVDVNGAGWLRHAGLVCVARKTEGDRHV